MKQRDKSIDFLKGFCMLLAIIGHSISTDSIGRHIIYSFHMPVFFIIGGIFLGGVNLI